MNSADQAAWVTGIGVIGPQGTGWESLRRSLAAPRPCFTTVPAEWLSYPGGPDAYIAPLDEQARVELQALETVSTDRACAMALASAAQAWAMSAPTMDSDRAGVWWGTGMGGLHTAESSYRRLLVEHQHLRPMTVVRIMGNSAAAQLAIKYKLQGPNHTYSVACASSALALGEALLAIRSGRIDLALVGGSEAMLVPGVMSAWAALRVLSTRALAESAELACRPFSSRRTGLVIGEGAAAFVLESARHARARGAVPLALLSGYGSTCDATSLVQPKPQGQIRAMHQAIADAGLQDRDIHAINAHATGTDTGDVAEAQSLQQVFGSNIPPISATKSLHGHLLGAAGALEAAVCMASLREQLIPATLGADPLDPRCGHLDLAHGQARAAELQHVMSNSFAFGGSNVSLIFSRPSGWA